MTPNRLGEQAHCRRQANGWIRMGATTEMRQASNTRNEYYKAIVAFLSLYVAHRVHFLCEHNLSISD